MSRKNDNLTLISVVASGLGALCDRFVFVGGSIARLLMTGPELADARPTDDVDLVIEAVAYPEYNGILEELRKLDFQHDISADAPRLS